MPSNKPRLSTTVTMKYKNALDGLVERGVYINREEAMRAGFRLLFKHHNLDLMCGEAEGG